VIATPASGASPSKDMSNQRIFLHSAVVLQVVIVHRKPLNHSLVIGLLHIL
jgi:hypothetical protein